MKYYKYIIIVLSILVLGMSGYIIYLYNRAESPNKDIKVENNEDKDIVQNKNLGKEYDCSYTKTYRIVNLLEGYVAEVPELSYVVLDAYQSHGAFTHIIPTTTKKGLKENKYYEFTYTIKGTGIINDENDVRSYIGSTEINQNNIEDSKLKVTLEIKETDKLGMEQVQENICEGK